MRNSRVVPASKGQSPPITPKSLAAKMSEIISLREKVAQAELSAGAARLAERTLARTRKPGPRILTEEEAACGPPSEDPAALRGDSDAFDCVRMPNYRNPQPSGFP